ncbi:putative bifunctional diguanylate cyclase/phosphodiesterase [Sanguibacter suaedae]|uniref:Bifunctional diguanylate cyclase/phosphodiesterase n=1 Tax=Sanguibacter suaedae TaxID=2795737 RepID=A0A934ID19_9MICO|nr:bifunctional diguanylate cyclase/phosphodiesterase [Sanguibacter suaedae]MBI9115530.1 bifunctional diguanylate cyclase/phosphodiesterase [Sanguibacter suaedae]
MAFNDPRETSGITTKLLLQYVRERTGDAGVADLLERARVPWTVPQLEDPTHWVGYDTRIRLFEAATAVVGHDRVMFEVGAESFKNAVALPLLPILRGFGTPREVYKRLPSVTKHFSTTSTLSLLEVTRTSAVFSFQLHEGYTPSHLDCEYAQGLFSAIPLLWGLPPAHVDHSGCGTAARGLCRYEVAWQERRTPLWGRRVRDLESRLVALRLQMQELQLAASDLVASPDVESVLDGIVEHAGTVAGDLGYVLALDPTDGTDAVVRSRGVPQDRAEALALALLEGADPGPGAVVVDVSSPRRTYGRLVALESAGRRLTDDTRALLEAYARHGAAALDLLTALEGSRREQERTEDLLSLAHDLSTVSEPTAVADVLATSIPKIVGCRAATVMLWDPSDGALRPVASAGHTQEQRDLLSTATFRSEEVPELLAILRRRDPVLVDALTASPVLARVLASTGSRSVIVVPLLAGDELLGVATAGFTTSVGGTPRHAEALARIAGVSDQGATALQNARLLATVRHQSQHDALTGLPNRVLFARRLDEVLRASESGRSTAVLFCDLDRFKHINDGLGHAAGDELLRQVSARLRGELRPGDLVGRLGGDEFAVLLDGVEDERQPYAVATRLVDALDEPFRLDGREVRITASMGVAIHTGPDGRGDRLLKSADSAMYVAKQSGRNQVAVAGESLARRVAPSFESELGRAAGAGELRLFFQPVVDVSADGPPVVVGAEALLRWEHPRLGLLAPGAFLPLAEEAGLVTELDLWALAAACDELARWHRPPGEPMRVAVNLASATLVDPRLVPAVRSDLARNALDPGQLHLEVVESRSLVDLPGVIERMAELRKLGVRIALDDFGTGYSTLAWLQTLPVDQVKIDRSFIMRLPQHEASLAVVRAVLSLAQELGIEVIAEGVEEEGQLAALRDVGCVLVQGYLLGRPAPAPGTPVGDGPVR